MNRGLSQDPPKRQVRPKRLWLLIQQIPLQTRHPGKLRLMIFSPLHISFSSIPIVHIRLQIRSDAAMGGSSSNSYMSQAGSLSTFSYLYFLCTAELLLLCFFEKNSHPWDSGKCQQRGRNIIWNFLHIFLMGGRKIFFNFPFSFNDWSGIA